MSTKLLTSVVLTAIVTFAADNFTGTWKLNMEKSRFIPAAPVNTLVTTREETADGVKVTSVGEQADGTAIESNNTVKYDGKSHPSTGTPWDTITIKRVDANSLTSIAKNSRNEYVSNSRAVVSNDGKTMMVTSHGTTGDGKPFNYVMFFDKQ